MKNTKLVKIITLVLSCLLLVGAVIGISVSAADETTVTIKAKNLSYEGAIKVLYAVDAQNVPADAEVKMYFYTAKDGALAYEKAAHSKDMQIGTESYKVFFSEGIAPKNMRTPIYAKAVVISAEGAVLAESAVAEYSIWQYATNRFAKNPTEDQLFLYTAMLDYGASVQKMLVESKKMTEQDVINAGGWANAYCGIRQNTVYNGSVVETGDVNFYVPGEAVTLTASNSYGADGVFADITDADENTLTSGAYPKANVTATVPGVSVYTANYEVTGYKFRTFDDLCIDGSENDVNILHKGKVNYDAQNAFGTYALNTTFGNDSAAAATAYQRVISKGEGNNAYLIGSNGTAGNNALAYSLDRVYYNADKYIIQFDLNYHGRTDSGKDNDHVWFRIMSEGINADAYDLTQIYLVDTGASATTYTVNGVTFNKNQSYTIRIEVTPVNRAYFDLDMYVDGVLEKSSKNLCPYASSWSNGSYDAVNDVQKFIGLRVFNRKSTDYSYELDNVYVGIENEKVVGSGKYADNELTYTFDGDKDINSYVYQGEMSSSTAKIENGVFNKSQSSVGFKNSGSKTGSKYVFETDFYVDISKATTTLENKTTQLAWWGLNGTDSRGKANQFASYELRYTGSNGGFKKIYITRNDGATTEIKTILPNIWYNIRVEYTPTTEYQGFVEFYVNGELMIAYTANGYANGGNITNAEFWGVGFEYRAGASSASGVRYLYDNTYVGTENVYTPGHGAYYTKAEYAGTRYDCATLDSITFGMDGESASSTTYLKDTNGTLTLKYGSKGQFDTAFGIANKPLDGAEALPEGNVHVLETDIRFTSGYYNGGGENMNIGWMGMSSDGFDKGDSFAPFAIYGVRDENNVITAYQIRNHKKDGEVVATIETGSWHNLRFVYTANTEGNGGTVEVFVNNESVYSYTTEGYSTNDTDIEPNNVFSQLSFQFRTVGASSVGWLEMQLDNIFLGTFNTAE